MANILCFKVMTIPQKPSYIDFNNSDYPWKAAINYQQHPELYRVGKGEQGVLICEPYKSAIGQYWRFSTPAIATKSSKKIFQLFKKYLKANDFVGADMARKYLQMGYTRARRYANYKGGKKYDKENNHQLLERGTGSLEKAKSAEIFYKFYKEAASHPTYTKRKKEWQKEFG